MLTMGEPIKLKTGTVMGTLGDGFAERISGNYQMLEERMTPTDMLHFVSAPPEMYVEEAGMAPLVNNNRALNIQNVNMQLINNVLNRILLTEHIDMTYQDRVFVENILNKIGVTDVQEFIRQVNRMKQEVHNTRELLTLYRSGDEVSKLIREYRTEENGQHGKQEIKKTDEEHMQVYWLQQEVFNRLHTEEIYQELANLIHVRYGNKSSVSRQEMQLCEQSMYAEQLTLNRMRNETFLQEQGLVYNKINTYEAGDTENVSENYEQTMSSMIQAVLLNAISQMYHTRYTLLTSNASTWQWLTDAIHVNAQNTFQRFESYHNRLSLSRKDKDEYYETLQKYENQEIKSLQRLFNYKDEVQLKQTGVTNMSETSLQYLNQENLTEEKEFIQDTLNEIHVQQKDEHKHVFKISQKQREEEILKQLDIINRSNLERLEKLQTLEKETKISEPVRINREQAKKDGLRALEHPDEVVTEYLNSVTVGTETEKIDRERLREVMGEDTIRILETLQGYKEHPERYPNVTTSEGQAMNLLMHDIADNRAERAEQLRIEQERLINNRVKEESSKEIERVLKETERHQIEHVPEGKNREQTVKDTTRILETLRDYREQPEHYPDVTAPEEQAVNLLVHDIADNRAERAEQLRIEQERLINNRVKEESSKEIERVLKETERHQIERMPEGKNREQTVKDTTRILETLRDYREQPEHYPDVTAPEEQAANLLVHDIADNRTEHVEQLRIEQERLVNNRVREESSKEIERVLKETERHQIERVPEGKNREQAIKQQAELFHKQNESVLNEEILEELEKRNRKTTQSEIRTQTEQQETTHVTEIVTNKVNELRLEQDQDIERIISRNVKQQLNTLSDQVFSKLEKRMDSERRRRGI